jgi:hypothetical protein
MNTSRTNVVATLLIALVLAGASGAASARTVHDGVWSVVVAAAAGPCNGAYRYPVAIVNGYVRPAGDRSFNIVGRVDRGGHVRVQVSRGDQSAYGVGRLSRLVGSGTWRSPNGCVGYWQATRRD